LGEVPTCFVRKCTFEKKEDEPIGEVQFFHQDSNITYIAFIPKAVLISTKTPNHGFCCIEQDGAWYEVNDTFIKKIPKEWEHDLFHFMGGNGSMVLYEQKIGSIARLDPNDPQDSLEEKKGGEMIDQEEGGASAYDPSSISQEWKNFAASMSKKSFYYHQRYQQLLQLEGKESLSSPQTLRERMQSHREFQQQLRKERMKYGKLST
jgi:hypothetical protein